MKRLRFLLFIFIIIFICSCSNYKTNYNEVNNSALLKPNNKIINDESLQESGKYIKNILKKKQGFILVFFINHLFLSTIFIFSILQSTHLYWGFLSSLLSYLPHSTIL